MVKKSALLMQPNPKRSIHSDLFSFIKYLFEKLTSVETVCRRESMKLWEALVRNLPPQNSENMPDNPRNYIIDFNTKVRKEKSLFKRIQAIRFEEDEEAKASLGSTQLLSIRDSSQFGGSAPS